MFEDIIPRCRYYTKLPNGAVKRDLKGLKRPTIAIKFSQKRMNKNTFRTFIFLR